MNLHPTRSGSCVDTASSISRSVVRNTHTVSVAGISKYSAIAEIDSAAVAGSGVVIYFAFVKLNRAATIEIDPAAVYRAVAGGAAHTADN